MGYTGDKKYTIEEITEAVKKSKSFREVAHRLGNYNERAKESLRIRIHQAEIDVSHFEANPIFYTKERLEEAVKICKTFGEVTRYFGRPLTSRRHIRNKIKDFDIDTSHFEQVRTPPGRRKDPEDYFYKQDRSEPRIKTHSLRKAMLAVGFEHVCSICGLPPVWQGKELKLQIDHINGDTYDHRQENLRFLCPNCHCQTETWGHVSTKSK